MHKVAETQSIVNKNENQPTLNSCKGNKFNTAKILIEYTVLFIGASNVLDEGVDHI